MKTVWILSDGKAGTEGQAVGLATALGLDYTLFRLTAKLPWKYIPGGVWVNPLDCIQPALPDDLPDMVIASGRITAAPAKALKKKGVFTIFIQNPYMNPRHFDVVVCPNHDHLKGKNVISTLGSLHRLTSATLDQAKHQFTSLFSPLPGPRFTLLIGGNSNHATFTDDYVAGLIKIIRDVIKQKGGTILMTASRRTPEKYVQQLKNAFADLSFYCWDGHGENPYGGLLAWGDYIIVTGDSVSMVSEAAFTGKPVYIYDIPGNAKKIQQFHQSLYKDNYAKPLYANTAGSDITFWIPPLLNETERVAQLIQKKLL